MKPNKDSNGIKISLLVQKVTDLAIGNSSTWTILLLSWVKITPSWLLQVLSTKCVAGKDGFVAVDHAHHEDGLGAVHKVRERFFCYYWHALPPSHHFFIPIRHQFFLNFWSLSLKKCLRTLWMASYCSAQGNTVGISFCFITTGTPLDWGQDEQKLRDYTVRNYLTAKISNMFSRKLEQLLQIRIVFLRNVFVQA